MATCSWRMRSHLFNLVDARGAISVAERASWIARVRELAKGCASAWVKLEKAREEAAA
jgi:glycyl-tRNA synthetase alpha chain